MQELINEMYLIVEKIKKIEGEYTESEWRGLTNMAGMIDFVAKDKRADNTNKKVVQCEHCGMDYLR